MCVTIGRSVDRRRPPRCSSTRAIAVASIRAGILQAIVGSWGPMLMPASMISMQSVADPARLPKRHVGVMVDASCLCSPMSPKRHWRSRQCAGSIRSSTLSVRSTDFRWRSGMPSDKPELRRLWRRLSSGCEPSAASSRVTPMWRKRWTVCFHRTHPRASFLRLGDNLQLLVDAPASSPLTRRDDLHHAVHQHTLSTTLVTTLRCPAAQTQVTLAGWIRRSCERARFSAWQARHSSRCIRRAQSFFSISTSAFSSRR